jgi:hypothetical protein
VADEGISSEPAQTGVRSLARAGVRTWPVGGAQWGWNGVWPDIRFAVPARIRFGSGIVLYFSADHEPAWWAAVLAAAIAAIAVIFLRRRPLAFVLALGFFAISAGFAVATIKATLIAHPILRFPAYSAGTQVIVPKNAGRCWIT